MKRALFLCLAALPAFGLTPLTRGNRIGILRAPESFANAIGTNLRDELSQRGFKAFDARGTFEDVQRGGVSAADFYVEVVWSDATQHHVASVGANVGPAVVDVGVVVARVAAELRLYDGRTLELIDRYDLRDSRTAVAPTGVGLGTRSLWGYIVLPIVQRQQYRAAAHEVAVQAAERIANR